MVIERLEKKDENLWDTFVNKSQQATFYYQIGWKNLVEKFYSPGMQPIYLLARDDTRITGILPLFLIKNRFSNRKKLLSIPFAVYGGVCADSEQISERLIDKAIELVLEFNADYLELRNINKQPGNLVTNDTFFTLILQLASEPGQVWQKLHTSIRKRLKRAMQNGLAIDLDSNKIDEFYALYSRGQRDLGTPVLDFRWLQSLMSDFSQNHTIATVRYQDKLIAAKFIRRYKDTVTSILGYALPEYRDLYPNHLLFWELIQVSGEQGYKFFDFGRSIQESGTYSFKMGWGAQSVQLHYQYYLNKIKYIPDTSQASRKRQVFACAWKKLPVPIANTIGPAIRKYYP